MKEQASSKQKYKNIIAAFKNDKIKNANKIVDVIEDIENGEQKILPNAIGTLHKMFIILLRSKSIRKCDIPEDLQDSTQRYTNWLFNQYERAHQQLINLLSHSVSSIRELALISIIKLVQAEGKHPIGESDKKFTFPKQRFFKLIKCLVSNKESNQELISNLQQYMEYQDVIFYIIRSLSNIVKNQEQDNVTENFIGNLFAILEQIDIPSGGKFSNYHTLIDDAQAQPSIDPSSEAEEEESNKSDESNFSFNYVEAQKNLNAIWKAFIRYKLPLPIYKKALVHIPEKAMQHIRSPVQLTDFFMDAYDLGGAFSLLALQGVFILINKHNLDYPSFYTKLYSLLQPNIFHAKYKPRFFMLLNLFLSSTHLPEYLVAAFAKRLSRLSLVAPSHSLVLIVKFVANLLVRFRGLKKLINNPDVDSLDEDPFKSDEIDPLKSNAAESSLWEIATLKSHINPVVSKAATFVDRNPPDMECDISDLVETTYEEVFEKARKIHMKEIPTTFHKPVSIFSCKDDQMSNSFVLY